MAVTAWCHPTAADAGQNWTDAANATEDDTAIAYPGADGHINDWTAFKDAAETNSLLDLLPSDLSSIDGIEVRLRALDPYDSTGTFNLVLLSYNAGTNFTSNAHADARNPAGSGTYAGTAATYDSGGATNLFGRTWSRSEFSDANFVFRLEADTTDGYAEDQDLEFIQLRVYYTPSGGSISGSGAPAANASSASGTAERELPASGTPSAQSANTAGTSIREVVSAGVPAMQSSTTTASAEREITGTGTLAAAVSATTGAGGIQLKILLTAAVGRELRDENGDLVASLSNISYEWYEKTTDTDGDPDFSGTFNTDGSGEATIQLPGSVLTSGQEGILILKHPTDSEIWGIYQIPVT